MTWGLSTGSTTTELLDAELLEELKKRLPEQLFRGRGGEPKGRELQEITKEVVGTHALLQRLLFGGGILRR